MYLNFKPIIQMSESTTVRPLFEIAREIKQDWKKVPHHALEYLNPMLQLNSIKDMYYADPASHIVNYFLANAGSWRGETAKRIKDELKAMVKGK